MGMPVTWFAGYWHSQEARASLQGPAFSCADYHTDPEEFSRHLDIANGVLHTKVKYENGAAYESRMFFSHANRNLMVIELKNASAVHEAVINLRLNHKGFNVTREDNQTIYGVSAGSPYTRMAWAAHLSRALNKDSVSLILKPGETVNLRHSFAVHWDGEDFEQRASDALERDKDVKSLFDENEQAWQDEWRSTAVVVIPDKAYEKLFYRSIYWMLSTAGSQKFLPGEVQFSVPTWKMHAFTYGGGGWPIFAYTYLGLPDHARRMLNWHFKPEAFKTNAAAYLDPGRENPDAWSFAHELSSEGLEIANEPWYSQRHIEGFAVAFFLRYHEYYPDAAYEKEYLWPVLRGAAEFWRSVAYWDEDLQAYLLPKLLSVSENIQEHSVLDAVLAAKYCLMMASAHAENHRVDSYIDHANRDACAKE